MTRTVKNEKKKESAYYRKSNVTDFTNLRKTNQLGGILRQLENHKREQGQKDGYTDSKAITLALCRIKLTQCHKEI
jgi:hypothetical protein